MANITLIHDCDIERMGNAEANNNGFDDCYLDEEVPDRVLNASETFQGIKNATKQAQDLIHGLYLYNLNLFVPADAAITSAVWHVYVTQTNATDNHTFQTKRITRTDWVEGEATWNEYRSGSSWTNPGGDVSTPTVGLGTITTTGWKNYDITSMVTDAWNSRGGICTFRTNRSDSQTSEVGWVAIRAKVTGAPGFPSPEMHHLRITYTLAGKTFQVTVR